jgi:hypothetical protein
MSAVMTGFVASMRLMHTCACDQNCNTHAGRTRHSGHNGAVVLAPADKLIVRYTLL